MVTANDVDAALVLPAVSVCLVVKVCTPGASALAGVILQIPNAFATVVPSTVVPSLSYSVTVAPASTAAPLMVGVSSEVMLSLLSAPVSLASVRSSAPGAAGLLKSILTGKFVLGSLTLPA